MDDFGVLVKNYGINPKGKSAPMSALKKSPKTQKNQDFFNQDPNFFTKPYSNSNSGNGSLLDDKNDDIFGFKTSQTHVNGNVFGDDVFNMPTKSYEFDVESVLKGEINSGSKSGGVDLNVNGDDIWGFSGESSSNVDVGSSNNNNSGGDLLSSDPVDDFWGKFAKMSFDQRGVKRLEESNDYLIPGFEKSFTVNHRPCLWVKIRDNPLLLRGFYSSRIHLHLSCRSSCTNEQQRKLEPEKQCNCIGVVIEDKDFIDSLMNGQPWMAGKFSKSLRLSLWAEHLGLSVGEISQIEDPVADRTYKKLWMETAEANSIIYQVVFECTPNDHVFDPCSHNPRIQYAAQRTILATH